MAADEARAWARRWGSCFISLGDAGHINAEAGFGPLPQAKFLVVEMARRLAGEQRLDRAQASELSFAI
jgi:predicted alpha/beta hydrolase family esterase